MAGRNPGGTLTVRAECPAGHVTETTAPPGRLTWRGECHQEGCTHHVVARRVPGQPEPDPGKAPATPRRRIRKAAGYRDPPFPTPPTKPAGDGGAGGGDPAGSPPRVPQTAEPAADPGAGGDGTGSSSTDGKRRRQRLPVRRASPDDPWDVYPGIY